MSLAPSLIRQETRNEMRSGCRVQNPLLSSPLLPFLLGLSALYFHKCKSSCYSKSSSLLKELMSDYLAQSEHSEHSRDKSSTYLVVWYIRYSALGRHSCSYIPHISVFHPMLCRSQMPKTMKGKRENRTK
jgi:hypothetical protein